MFSDCALWGVSSSGQCHMELACRPGERRGMSSCDWFCDLTATSVKLTISIQLNVPSQVPVFYKPEGVCTVLTNNTHGLVIQHNLCT